MRGTRDKRMKQAYLLDRFGVLARREEDIKYERRKEKKGDFVAFIYLSEKEQQYRLREIESQGK